MEKTSREYAEKMAKENNSEVYDTDVAYVFGYLKAVEETNVKELRDVCKKLKTALIFRDTIENVGQIQELLKIANNALNKTKS